MRLRDVRVVTSLRVNGKLVSAVRATAKQVAQAHGSHHQHHSH
jgi:hypothetical protein